MLNDELGKDFRASSWSGDRHRASRGIPRVLIADSVIGSRLLLADAVAQSGFLVTTVSNRTDARIAIEREEIALILVDENFPGDSDGLEFLVELRNLYPYVARALVTEEGELSLMGGAVDRADISFLLGKPWEATVLQQALRNVLLGERAFKGWDQVSVRPSGALSRHVARPRTRDDASALRAQRDSHHEVILRGILAGLNSVESEHQLFELVDRELAEAFRIQRWLCVDSPSGEVSRIRGQRGIEESALDALPSREEQALLREARSFEGVRSLSLPQTTSQTRRGCLGFVMEEAGNQVLTCLVWCDEDQAESLLEMLSDLRHGLNLTIRRIRDAECRAMEARQLADRVSQELKKPVGALTHAVDRMRGEAVRAGMPTEWVDRVLSESQRVVRAVDHLEGEMFSDRPSLPLTTS